jgi:pimeloyl-ACP methyl ester carboxylesterase
VRALALAAVALALASCAFPVEGRFIGAPLGGERDPRQTVLIIFNHGFSSENAGQYTPALPPILEAARARNPDVVVFSQVRNTSRLEAVHHASYIEAAIEQFTTRDHMPVENIILAGQSCGGWGSLQAAAFTYPRIGGVVVFAPTCHGRLPHSTETRTRRSREIAQLAERVRFPAVIFLYEGDSYYQLGDWDGFDAAAGRLSPALRVERVSRDVVFRVCPRCARDSHGAMWGEPFAPAYYGTHLQPLIERVREGIRARSADPPPR